MAWWCTGMRWRADESGAVPVLGWYGEEQGERESVLGLGEPLGFRAVGGRRCLGVWRGGRRNPCPDAAPVPATVSRAQCGECARIDRSRSVAADTIADDPRPYHVYLAWFGPGLLKVGITGVARGPARLLEQGAVAFSWLGAGPLMAARRAEELLRAALRVPDRIPYAEKRAVRAALPAAAERAAEIARLHAQAVALREWPESLERLPCAVVDHGGLFGLDGLVGLGEGAGAGAAAATPGPVPATGAVTELTDGSVVVGRTVAVAGPDLHLAEPAGAGAGAGGGGRESRGGRMLVVDSRLLAGWQLAAAPGATVTTAPVRLVAAVQGGLF